MKGNCTKAKRTAQRALLFLLIGAIMLSFTACSVEKNDEGFLKNLASGLQSRWTAADDMGTKAYDTDEAYRAALQKCIEKEKKAIGEISEYEFQDSALADLATQYCASVDGQLDGLKYMGNDEAKFDETYNHSYNERTRLLYLISQSYEVPVSDKYQQRFDDMCVAGESQQELNDALESINTSLAKTVLEKTDSNIYMGTVENGSSLSLTNVTINLVGYDDSGVVVTSTSSSLQTWESAGMHNVDFYTDSDFSTATLSATFLFNDSTIVETDPVSVSVVNELQLEITMPPLPTEISHFGYSGDEMTRCRIDSITMDTPYWTDGVATSVAMFFSGEKLYDQDGEDLSQGCQIGWKLYDSSNVVVDSGTLYTSNIRVGEQFSNDQVYVSAQLNPGTYRLEILNVE